VVLGRAQLRYFLTVAEEGQITRAAVKLHIAQPALSHAIATLESELGVQLLERHARGVTLTSAGEALLPKARVAVRSEREFEEAANSLARASNGMLEVGFIGPPPPMTTPQLFDAFAEDHPHAEMSFRDLPFPNGATAAWLEQVDVAFCHCPRIEPGIGTQIVRSEPRAALVHRTHRLSERSELNAADVLEDTFVSFDPQVQPEWSGFHNLDDCRGGPPRATTLDRAARTLQMLGAVVSARGITTAPLCDAQLAQQATPELVALPIEDASPAQLSLVWRKDKAHPLLAKLVAAAAALGED